jgi:uncharacterized protein (DUF983 family)
MLIDAELFKIGLSCKCPKCRQGDLYKPGLTLSLRDKCEVCGLDLSKNDSADGPAVFLIFVLGFLLVPLALLLEVTLAPPLWAHAVIWTLAALAITLGALRPLKAYIIAIQYKYRPGDWSRP